MRNACTHGSRNGPSSGLLWARWNRTIGLRIIRAGQRAGQPIGIRLDLPFRATVSHQKTARATSFGHALGTAAALADIIGPPPQRVLSALATLLPNDSRRDRVGRTLCAGALVQLVGETPAACSIAFGDARNVLCRLVVGGAAKTRYRSADEMTVDNGAGNETMGSRPRPPPSKSSWLGIRHSDV